MVREGSVVAKETSVKDVAAIAHVSLGTVSNVLNLPERMPAIYRRLTT